MGYSSVDVSRIRTEIMTKETPETLTKGTGGKKGLDYANQVFKNYSGKPSSQYHHLQNVFAEGKWATQSNLTEKLEAEINKLRRSIKEGDVFPSEEELKEMSNGIGEMRAVCRLLSRVDGFEHSVTKIEKNLNKLQEDLSDLEIIWINQELEKTPKNRVLEGFDNLKTKKTHVKTEQDPRSEEGFVESEQMFKKLSKERKFLEARKEERNQELKNLTGSVEKSKKLTEEKLAKGTKGRILKKRDKTPKNSEGVTLEETKEIGRRRAEFRQYKEKEARRIKNEATFNNIKHEQPPKPVTKEKKAPTLDEIRNWPEYKAKQKEKLYEKWEEGQIAARRKELEKHRHGKISISPEVERWAKEHVDSRKRELGQTARGILKGLSLLTQEFQDLITRANKEGKLESLLKRGGVQGLLTRIETLGDEATIIQDLKEARDLYSKLKKYVNEILSQKDDKELREALEAVEDRMKKLKLLGRQWNKL